MTLKPPHIVDAQRNFGRTVRGYILVNNSQIVVLREFDGFVPAGCVTLRRSDVKELAINEKWSEMIAAEGYAQLANQRPKIEASSFRQTLKGLCQQQYNLKLECENCDDAKEAGFHIGRIVAIMDSTLDFVFFDSNGKWFDNHYTIPLASITLINFDDPYVNTFSKYVGQFPVQSRMQD